MFSTKSLLVIGAVATIVAALSWSHTKAYQAGRAFEQASFLERINKENRDAGGKAEDWRGAYRRCLDNGGLFSFETGACDS